MVKARAALAAVYDCCSGQPRRIVALPRDPGRVQPHWLPALPAMFAVGQSVAYVDRRASFVPQFFRRR
jgi:hypothetical protein